MNTETLVLDDGDVKVTTARFIANGQTFALRNITSVKLQNAGSLRWPIVWAIFAAGSMAGAQAGSRGGEGAVLMAIVFGSLAALLWWRNSAHAIYITTSGKEQVAYTTRNKAYAQRVLQALNDAIAQR